MASLKGSSYSSSDCDENEKHTARNLGGEGWALTLPSVTLNKSNDEKVVDHATETHWPVLSNSDPEWLEDLSPYVRRKRNRFLLICFAARKPTLIVIAVR